MQHNIIQVGQHFNRSVIESTVLSLNVSEKRLEMSQKLVDQEHIPVLRQRARTARSANLVVEGFLVHKVDSDSSASYKITTNKYGITVIPWSLVTPEEMRKDATIIAFESMDDDRVLTISRDETLVSAAFQYNDEARLVYDTLIKRDEEGSSVSSAIINNALYVYTSEQDYDLVLIFPEIGEIDPEAVVEEFRAKRTFTI